MRLTAAALLLFSCTCAHPPALKPSKGCVTSCGLFFPDEDCRDAQAYQDRAFHLLHEKAHIRLGLICRAVHGWRVQVHTITDQDRKDCPPSKYNGNESWRSPEGNCCIGTAQIVPHILEVDRGDWPKSTLTHEILHAVDMRKGRLVEPWHCGWGDNGYEAAIEAVTGHRDATTDEASCPKSAPEVHFLH